MSIELKSLGQLTDELITCSQKLFGKQEIICRSQDQSEVAQAAKEAQALNARRNALIQAIDRVTGQPHSVTDKTYG